MVSRFIKGAAVILAASSFASAASAGCGNSNVCYSGHSSTLPALSSWSSAGNSSLSYSQPASYSTASSYSSGAYSSASSYGGTMSSSAADAAYGTGSISDTYVGGDVQMYGFSGQVAGLGMNESLQSTNCPTNVYGAPNGSRVLGCYNVVKPVPQTNYVRVVRPIIYVRYPVPVAVPTYSACNTVVTHTSRYGGYGPNGAYRSRCGW